MEVKNYTEFGRRNGKRYDVSLSPQVNVLIGERLHELLRDIINWAGENGLELRRYDEQGFSLAKPGSLPREAVLFSEDRGVGDYENPGPVTCIYLTVRAETFLGRECARRFFKTFEEDRSGTGTFVFLPVKETR